MSATTSSRRVHWLVASAVSLVLVGVSTWIFLRFTGLNPTETLDSNRARAACPPPTPPVPPLPVKQGQVSAGHLATVEWLHPWSQPATTTTHALSPINQGQTVTVPGPGGRALMRGDMRLAQVIVGPRSVQLKPLTENSFVCYSSPFFDGVATISDKQTSEFMVSGREAYMIDAAISYDSADGTRRSGRITVAVVDMGAHYGAFTVFLDDEFKERLKLDVAETARSLRIET